ncbi:MAG: YopN family type III secretion system gatekeeper subunit, partial [Aeromonas veronii]
MAIIQSNPYAPAAQLELRGAEVASRQAPLQGGQFQGERVVLA